MLFMKFTEFMSFHEYILSLSVKVNLKTQTKL